MTEKNDEKEIDITNKNDQEIIDYYAKISENILILNNLLDNNKKEEAIKKYQKIKTKL